MSNPLTGWSVDPAAITLTGTGLRRPECVLAENTGDLWVADLRGGVMHIDPDGAQELVRPREGGGPYAPEVGADIDGNQGFSLPNGLCFDLDGDLVIGNFGTNRVEHLTRSGEWRVVSDTVVWPDGSTRPIGKANFPALDADGRLWFSVTASAEAWRNRHRGVENDGYIAVIDDWTTANGSPARVLATDLGGANEMRFSPDGRLLYVAETGADHLTRYTVESGGSLTNREVYGPARLGGGPDGFAFDAHGNLWTTLITANRLVAITPEGQVLTLWQEGPGGATRGADDSPPLAPGMASITFAGADLCTVLIGSLGGTSLPTFRSPVPGAALAHWTR